MVPPPSECLPSPTMETSGSNQVDGIMRKEGTNTGIKQISFEYHPGRKRGVYPCVQFNLL